MMKNLKNGNAGGYITVLTAAFAISTYIFLCFALLYGKADYLNRKNLFFGFSFILMLWIVISLFVWPFKALQATSNVAKAENNKENKENVPLLSERTANNSSE